jgi:hypothetical protein
MNDTRRMSDETIQLQRGIEKLNAGDPAVRGELLNVACGQLMRLTSQLREEFNRSDHGELPDISQEDLFAGVSTRLYESLFRVPIKDTRHFYQIASVEIRRELIDLCRRGESSGNRELLQLAEFYDCVDSLPESQREVFELIWYHEMSRGEVAELLAAEVVEIKRLWRSARLTLHDRLDD